ncbi:MAG: histidine phosphotransferase [Limimaricola sp.]|nr:histidine phosphotransferase family protein [Limimaricola sp.]MBI1417988.1 histidine phosphotransferase [Limimaricola sp.]
MSTHRLDLPALIGSRICHDLISPLGAIGNGIELLHLTGTAEGAEMALISESVESASARIRFFRIAYGAAAPDQLISRAEVTAVLGASARGGRLSYMWEPADDQPRDAVRMVFLALQCLESAMPHGGDIAVRRDGPDWQIVAEAARIRLDDDLWACLTTPRHRAAIGPAQVQFALLPEALAQAGRMLSLDIADGSVTLRF